MDPAALAGLVLIGGIALFLAIGAPISIGVGVSSVAAMFVIVGTGTGALTAAQQMFRGINSFPLLAIPFFVLAGVIMNNGGIALRLIDAGKVMVGRMPGSLAQTNIAANALFGAVSGSSIAAAAAVGSTLAPMQAKEGYDKNFAAAANIASSPGGMLIPPSNLMIVYSLVSSTSVAALFVAGYLPGILWTVATMVVVWWYARKHPELKVTAQPPLAQRVKVVLDSVPALLLVVVVIGGILAGWFTSTEAAVIAVVYSAVLAVVYRSLALRDLPRILLDSTRTTAVVMFLIAVSTVMGFVLSFAQIPELASSLMFGISENPVVILLLITVVLLVVGCFMDATPAVLIFTPIFLPVVTSFGVDPIHFGIIMIYNLSIGTITPPVGTVLFVGAKIAGCRLEPVIRQLLPHFGALVITLVVVTFTPGLSLWLPQALGLIAAP
ncbi:tripartite ATP-independent transporter DctM subunit [Kineococcus radiotolerans]|uniref:TRAP dicarboxylate transporter, DctM subunit n=2 Tax=Kineococcus radiotolerans TaxID=131568 RepID=A6W4E8_KINRD|nr:TRAP transporter large permease [Kineococcus radiotolerans]ABS01687.1 TRAP dicarboxylate transporter, DctM subunit [Kineococcus radiotolerans SRS30216 = ATCC BAA-149]MBB2901183.1 tripartite ATP-independent transporter DctM subunit [Kineococcus radiotolerans]